uniref:Putative conserved secreted protein n=1 Tax=Rhipicephalus microplus TaxID=6941 RepID=A0A6G5A4C8_RHIMP
MRRAIFLLVCVASAYGQQKGAAGGVVVGGGPEGGSLSGISGPGNGPSGMPGGPGGRMGGGGAEPGIGGTVPSGTSGGPGGIGIGPGGPGGPGGDGSPGIMFGEPDEQGEQEGGGDLIGFGPEHGQLDLFTLLVRQIFLAYGADPLTLPETTMPFNSILRMSGTVHTYNSRVFGLSHVRRTGPCFVTADQSGMRLGLDLGIKDVYANSSATVQMANKNIRKQRVHFTVIVRKARAILEIAQTGAQEIHVTNFKILFLQGFKLFLRPDQPSRRPLFHAFLRAAQVFLERSVKRRLEPLVRKAIDTQIKTVLAYLNRQAELRPKPRLPPELFAGVAEGIFIGGPTRPSGMPSGPGAGPGGPGGVGPGGPGGPGATILQGGPSNGGVGTGGSLSGLSSGGPTGPGFGGPGSTGLSGTISGGSGIGQQKVKG